MFDAANCNGNIDGGAMEKQPIDLSWSISKDYEVRLLTYCNASEETLINSTRYDLDNEGKYIEMGYSTHLDLQPVIRIRDGATGCTNALCNARFNKNNVLMNAYEWEKFAELESHIMNKFFDDSSEIGHVLNQSFEDELSIQNMTKIDDITEDIKIIYHWEYSGDIIPSPMMSTFATTASDSMQNVENFVKTITLQRDYCTSTFNKYDMEGIFQLKPIINYRLELVRSSGLKKFYDNIVECTITQKSKREEIRRLAYINADDDNDNDFQVYDDGGVYEIFEQLLSSKYNINSYNVLCVMEIYRHRPGYILTAITADQ